MGGQGVWQEPAELAPQSRDILITLWMSKSSTRCPLTCCWKEVDSGSWEMALSCVWNLLYPWASKGSKASPTQSFCQAFYQAGRQRCSGKQVKFSTLVLATLPLDHDRHQQWTAELSLGATTKLQKALGRHSQTTAARVPDEDHLPGRILALNPRGYGGRGLPSLV